jgi:glutathione synthase
VFSPGGLGSSEKLYEVDFTEPVIEALEHKMDVRRTYDKLDNVRLATL